MKIHPMSASTVRWPTTWLQGLKSSARQAETNQTGVTAKNNNNALVWAMYFSGGASCVMRHTQLAVSEMGSEKTLRRPKTAKPIIMKKADGEQTK